MASPQALTDSERRIVAVWAADCAERVLPLFEQAAPRDSRPRESIARLRRYAAGEVSAAEARRGAGAHAAARDVRDPAARAAARAAGQAGSVPHMGAHALGAAAYAATAAGLASDRPDTIAEEIAWQLAQMSDDVRAALQRLPLVGTNTAGPLGPGLLASGERDAVIRALQAALGVTAP